MNTVLFVLGWMGSAAIVSAFALKAKLPLKVNALLNLTGSLALGASLLNRSAYDGVALQCIWAIISIFDFLRGSRAKSRGMAEAAAAGAKR